MGILVKKKLILGKFSIEKGKPPPKAAVYPPKITYSVQKENLWANF